MVRPTLPTDMFLHPENKQTTLLDMQTARRVAAKREILISLIRLGMSDVVLEVNVLGTCLGRGQGNYNCSDIRPVECRTLYQLQSLNALPPTSSDTRGHIHRGAFLVNRACRLLATDNEREARLEPVEH